MARARITIPMVVRMRALSDVGLSYAAIAAVISLDWETSVTGGQVRHWLRFYVRESPRPRNRGGAGMSQAAGDRRGAVAVREAA